MRNSSSFADSLVELIGGQVQEAINDMDLSDQIEKAISNSNEIEKQVEKQVESAMDDLDIDDKVKDSVADYDMSEAIESVIKDNYDFPEICKEAMDELLGQRVKDELEEIYKSAGFIDVVDAIVQHRLHWIAAAKRAKLVDYVKFGPLVRFVKGKYAALVQWVVKSR
jgi:hypothetical protein